MDSEPPLPSIADPTLNYATHEQQGWPAAVRVVLWAIMVFVAIDVGHLMIGLVWSYRDGFAPTIDGRISAILSGASAVGNAALLWGLMGCLKWTTDGYRTALLSAKCLVGVMILALLSDLWYGIEWASNDAVPFWMGSFHLIETIIRALANSIVPVIAWVILSRPVVKNLFTLSADVD